MHEHGNKKMMWLMMAGCLLLPLAFLLFGGRVGGFGGSWGWFAFIGAFILIHVLMMFGHGHSADKGGETNGGVTKLDKPDDHQH